jgi:uncharacterized sporulation protein YeaH/YhbH (DUF444 family)
MDNILGLIGTITGVAGLLVAVLIVRRQEIVHARELAEERAERAREQAERARELAEERAERARELAEERARNERTERLIFLADRIFDISIPRDLRLPFYEEYISMKGNGTAVKFWLMEGEMGKKK